MPQPDPVFLRRYVGVLRPHTSRTAKAYGYFMTTDWRRNTPEERRTRFRGAILFDLLAYNDEQVVAIMKEFVGDDRPFHEEQHLPNCLQPLADREGERFDEGRKLLITVV